MTHIWIDTDPGLDDALALIWAIQMEKKLNWKIEGVSTVKGNLDIKQVNINALAILEHLNRTDIPVYSGAEFALIQEPRDASYVHGNRLGPFQPNPKTSIKKMKAPEALAQTLDSVDSLTLVTLGPLTNIAILLRLYPHLKTKIKEIFIMGGGTYGNMTYYSEFNIFIDPEAAWIVFNSDIPIVMSGLDISDNICYVTKEEIEKHQSQVKSSWAVPMLNFILEQGYSNVALYDPTAMIAAAHLELFELVKSPITVELTGEARGMTLMPTRATFEKSLPNNINTKFLSNCKRDDFLKVFFGGL